MKPEVAAICCRGGDGTVRGLGAGTGEGRWLWPGARQCRASPAFVV